MFIKEKNLTDTTGHIVRSFYQQVRHQSADRLALYEYSRAELDGLSKLFVGHKAHAHVAKAIKEINRLNQKLADWERFKQAASAVA